MCNEIKGVLMRVVQYYTTKIKINISLHAFLGMFLMILLFPSFLLGKGIFKNIEQRFLQTRILKQCFKTWPSLPGFFVANFSVFLNWPDFRATRPYARRFVWETYI